MARPAKSQAREDARGELIEAAWQLFSRAGYEATPVSAIIDKVGLSKGTFYYYFAGKEDILDAVVSRMIAEIAREVEPIPYDATLSPPQKLNAFISAIRDWKSAHMDIVQEAAEVLYRDENVIIRHKVNNRAIESLTPVLARIIAQGIETKDFDVEGPEETAEIILRFFNAMAETQAASFLAMAEDPSSLELVMHRTGVYMGAIERMLGVAKGAIFAIDDGMKERLELALKGSGRKGSVSEAVTGPQSRGARTGAGAEPPQERKGETK